MIPAFALVVATALTPVCHGADRPNAGISVNGKSSDAYDVTSASAVSTWSPDGDVTFASFAYLYGTRGAGPYLALGSPSAWIVHVSGTDVATIRHELSVLEKQMPPSEFPAGATAALKPGWKLSVLPCAAP